MSYGKKIATWKISHMQVIGGGGDNN